jgi:hypothetical protein
MSIFKEDWFLLESTEFPASRLALRFRRLHSQP